MSERSRPAPTDALHVHPGDEPILLMHEIGGPEHARVGAAQWAGHTLGAWTYTQRGHAATSWVKGGFYPLSIFCTDLALVLDGVGEPTLVIGVGLSSALAAALLAAALPELISGLQVLPGTGGPWDEPALVIADTSEVNRSWWLALNATPGSPEAGMDPMLTVGPPHAIPESGLRKTLREFDQPWHAPAGHPVHEWFAASTLRPGPFVRDFPALIGDETPARHTRGDSRA